MISVSRYIKTDILFVIRDIRSSATVRFLAKTIIYIDTVRALNKIASTFIISHKIERELKLVVKLRYLKLVVDGLHYL